MPCQPEVIFRYINLLVSLGPSRIDDAVQIAATALILDPGNGTLKNLVEELERIRQQQIRPAVPSIPNEPPTTL